MSDKDKKNPVLIADTNTRNLELLNQFLIKEGCTPTSVSKLEDLKAVLESKMEIDLAIVDISSFGKAIWEYCARLQQEDIPLLIISPPRQSNIVTKESIRHGASGVLTKPVAIKELRFIIHES